MINYWALIWNIYHIQSHWHRNPVTQVCNESAKKCTKLLQQWQNHLLGSAPSLCCFVLWPLLQLPPRGCSHPGEQAQLTAPGIPQKAHGTAGAQLLMINSLLWLMRLHRNTVQTQRGISQSWEETNRSPCLVWVCIRCSVYIIAFKSEVNLRKLGRDNQEQHSPLVEVLCNIYEI